jgi:predicted site-specific integrase-resolvase
MTEDVQPTETQLEALFLTTSQFARLLGVSAATVKRRCNRGQLACLVVSDRGDRRIPSSELARLRAEANANLSAEPA